MALENENMVMPVGPMNNGGIGFGGDGIWFLILFFLLAGGGMWGNGFGGGDLYPWMNNSQNINDGFRDQMMATNINGIQSAITSGFGDIQTALCGGFAGVNASITNAQMNNMQNTFALQSQLSQCCCDNRLATVQTQNVVQAEGAATRLAIMLLCQCVCYNYNNLVPSMLTFALTSCMMISVTKMMTFERGWNGGEHSIPRGCV